MRKLLPYIKTKLDQLKLKYEVHDFDSGAVMVDIYIEDKFYVIQIDGEEIGLSLNTEDTMLFDIIPDKTFKDADLFKTEFEKILPLNK